jgi:HK97 family phage major capsid protein
MKHQKNKSQQSDAQGVKLSIRAAEFEHTPASGDAAASVRMTVSSELPVLSWVSMGGEYMRAWEILDHSESSIDMSRAGGGLVVLDRHYGDQIGLIAAPQVSGDRKLGGQVEFCTGERAQEIAADAAKGLRRNVSVGYAVDSSSYRVEGTKDGIPVVRAMSWTPYEASFEPVPADSTVGVNRAAKEATVNNQQEKKMDLKEIQEINRLARQHGIAQEIVDKHLEADKSLGDFRALVIEKQAEDAKAQRTEIEVLRARKPATPDAQAAAPLGGSKEEQAKITRKYSVLNVLRSLAGHKVDVGFEREVSEECARASGKVATGIMIPHAVLAQRDLTKLGTSSATVATDLLAGEFIDLLRSKTILAPLGVRFLTGLVGDVAIPKMSAGATGYWVAESGDITESAPTLGQVTGSPHTCGALVDISRRLLLQSSPSAEMLVRDEIVERIARTIQIAVFAGTGADGQPSAITAAAGINNPTVTQGTPTFAQLLDFPGSILTDNASSDNMKWAMTGEVWAKLAATATNGAGSPLALDFASKTLIGFPYEVSEDVGANSLFFGNWASVMVGVWGNGVDINADTATLSSQGALRLVGLQDVDVMVRLGQALAYNAAVTS